MTSFSRAIVAAIMASLLTACATMSVEQIVAASDGATEATAYEVSSVRQEYEILRYLGLQPGRQALVMKDGKAYDVITASDPATGETRKIWFDISSFYGSGF